MAPQSTAVVLGSGRCVWGDLRALRTLAEPTMFAVNDMVVFAPTVHHAVSHHPDKLAHWNALRTHSGGRKAREKGIVTHSSAPGAGIDRVWREYRGGGSSSYLAVRIALALGHEHVIIAGVPLDARGYVWADPHGALPYDFARYRKAWDLARGDLLGRVTAVSGYLRELLGAPEAEAAEVLV